MVIQHLFIQEFSSSEATAPDSPDDLFLKDLNPCLTPNVGKTRSKVNTPSSYTSVKSRCLVSLDWECQEISSDFIQDSPLFCRNSKRN